MVPPDRVAKIKGSVAIIRPRTRFLLASFGRIPLSAIADPPNDVAVASAIDDGDHRHLEQDGFVAHSFRFPDPLLPDKFQRLLDRALPSEVFRAKGIVAFKGVEGRHVFQLCGGRAAFEPYDGPVTETRLVFTGRGLDRLALSRSLEDCRAHVVRNLGPYGPATSDYSF